MGWRFFGVFAFLLVVCGQARAESVPPAPAPTAAPVVEEQHPIQVGDVIMAPAIETAEAEKQPERGRFSPAEKRQPRHWYGAPILVADSLAYASLALAFNAQGTSKFTLPLGISAYAVAGPITHAVHGQWLRMGLSITVRATVPFTGLLLGATGCNSEDDCADSIAGGVLAGMLVATIVDAAVVAHEPVPEAPNVQPLASIGRDQLWLGAGGTF